jgi:putative ABC transport system permease protein
MTLLLKWCLNEYKRHWFKSAVTFIGLVLSLSLFLVIELYVGVLSPKQTQQPLGVEYQYKLINTQGFIGPQELHDLVDKKWVTTLYPLSERRDKLLVNGNSVITSVVGLDILEFQAQASKAQPHSITTTETRPFNLSNAYYLSSDTDTGYASVKSFMADREIHVMKIMVKRLTTPVLVMDISQFQTLYQPHTMLDAIILDKSVDTDALSKYLSKAHPNLKIISRQAELSEKSKWTNSLRYNLKFLALIAMCVSASLLVQFFRFIGYQRLQQVDALFKLGVSKLRLAKVIAAECSIIAVLVFLTAMLVGWGIATVGLSIFNQTISTFYLQLSSSALVITPLLLIKMAVVVGLAVVLSYFSMTRKLFLKPQPLKKGWLAMIGCSCVAVAMTALKIPLSEWQVFATGAMLISGFACLTFVVIEQVTGSLSAIKNQKLLFFKMAKTSLQQDTVSYGIITFVIGVSLSLIVCMGIFVESFRTSVSQWLNNVIIHDIYIQHKANDIQFQILIPQEVEQALDHLIPPQDIHKISRIPIKWQGIPSQIQIVDDEDSIENITQSGPIYRDDMDNIAISEPFANKHGMAVGDTIKLEGIMPKPLHISAIYYDYTSEFGTLRIKRSLYERQNGIIRPNGIAISNIASIDKTALESLLSQISTRGDMNVQDRNTLKKQSIDLFNETFVFTWFMVFLIGGIAMICVLNVITMMCLDRQNELTQLWMMGFNRRRLHGILAAQLSLITGISSVIAVWLGALLYYFLVFGIQLPTFHWSIFIKIPWLFLASVIVLFAVLTWITSLIFTHLNSAVITGGMRDD